MLDSVKHIVHDSVKSAQALMGAKTSFQNAARGFSQAPKAELSVRLK